MVREGGQMRYSATNKPNRLALDDEIEMRGGIFRVCVGRVSKDDPQLVFTLDPDFWTYEGVSTEAIGYHLKNEEESQVFCYTLSDLTVLVNDLLDRESPPPSFSGFSGSVGPGGYTTRGISGVTGASGVSGQIGIDWTDDKKKEEPASEDEEQTSESESNPERWDIINI